MDTSSDPLPSCLVVDDDEAMRFLLRHHLESAGASVVEATTGEDALELIRDQDPAFELVVSDNRMPGQLSGLDVLSAAGKRASSTSLLLLTAHIDPELTRAAEAFGAETMDKVELPTVPRRWRAQARRRQA